MKPFVLNVDLDGVLFNFDLGFRNITGKWPRDVTKAELWAAIASRRYFYLDLPLMEETHELVDFVESQRQAGVVIPRFCTALPSGELRSQVESDKRVAASALADWDFVACVGSSEKWKHATPTSVLVDDFKANVNDWTAKGGGHRAFHYYSGRTSCPARSYVPHFNKFQTEFYAYLDKRRAEEV